MNSCIVMYWILFLDGIFLQKQLDHSNCSIWSLFVGSFFFIYIFPNFNPGSLGESRDYPACVFICEEQTGWKVAKCARAEQSKQSFFLNASFIVYFCHVKALFSIINSLFLLELQLSEPFFSPVLFPKAGVSLVFCGSSDWSSGTDELLVFL